MKLKNNNTILMLSILIMVLLVSVYCYRLGKGNIISKLPFVKNELIENTTIFSDEAHCNKDEDCIITSYTYECCGAPCGGAIINRTSFEKRKQWTTDNCNSESYAKCSQVNCVLIEEKAVCKNNNCIKQSL